MTATVRHARPADLPRVVRLIAEHAAFERADPPAPDLAQRLDALLFGTPEPRLRCLVAESAEHGIVGYASCEPALSTWQGRAYLHMDCLYLSADARGGGIGRLLVAAVAAEARALGLDEIQWQTPTWNKDAARFYDRLGAHAKEKLRYSLAAEVSPAADRAP
ncbi:GNAT family N-acetyltransferase [Streptomyces sp. VRA16 Mangrove soil]|uniref:GNAT family N-acetyltransferase n=1 Tax=Streptomyces sp. VRA16 Mangrove soil TaxID=2817434 RepID=UPI001A9D9A8A|nr:GNAT family N-acetyltransferase [Streptomyces sp. VRA16 Mangrove soil]MBO1337815.1 GNAT family N-acetyltransferase [Streptomyces sp. VRA16 Mangrove soil]